MTEITTSYRIAVGVLLSLVVVSISLGLVFIGRNYFSKTMATAEVPAAAMADNDAFNLTAYGKPVPVASVWKLVKRINKETTAPDGAIASFSLKTRNNADPNSWDLQSTSVASLEDYLTEKAYISWTLDGSSGLYTLEVLID